jgi:hypothetical protein
MTPTGGKSHRVRGKRWEDPRWEMPKIEEVHPDVPVCELCFAMRRELLRRQMAKLKERLEEQDL